MVLHLAHTFLWGGNPGVYPCYLFKFDYFAAPAAILQFLSATGHDWAWVRTAQKCWQTTSPTGYCYVCFIDYSLYILLYVCTD